ncbi:MAG: PP2C family protein-serine/threonine phosphatase [Burkholderiaceae bacterium]
MFASVWQAWKQTVDAGGRRLSGDGSLTRLNQQDLDGVRGALLRHNLKMVWLLMPVAVLATVGLVLVDLERYAQGLLGQSPTYQALALAHGIFMIATLMGLRYYLPRWHGQGLQGDRGFIVFLTAFLGSIIAMSLLGIVDRGSTTLMSIALMLMNCVFRLPLPVLVVVNVVVLLAACVLRLIYGSGFTSTLIAMLELMSLSVVTLVAGFGLSRQTVMSVLGELREARRSQRYSEELEIAARMQVSLLPKHWPKNPEFSLYGFIKPAKEVGGDFFDHFSMSQGRHAMIIADVCDKGFASGLFGMMCKTEARSSMLHHASIEEAFDVINEDLAADNEECMFVTCVGLSYSPSTGMVHLVNAGHVAPLLIKADGEAQWVKAPRCPPLGVRSGRRFESIVFKLEPGDALLLMTDGVTEALNAAGQEFGMARVLEALRGVRVTDPSICINTLNEVVADYTRGVEQSDDIAYMSLLHRGSAA